MKRSILSIITIISFILSNSIIGYGLNDLNVEGQGETGNSLEYRNGFLLEVSNSDETGIETNTNFILTSKESLKTEDVKSGFSIVGQKALEILSLGSNKFQIKLEKELKENSIITCKLNVTGKPTTSCTFQTQEPFRITGSLPGNEMKNVPLNSGIEIYFNKSNFDDLSKYFEITPSVSGRFEVHDKTGVFVPDKLDEDTIYTAKVKKELKLKGTNKTLGEDYIFSFLTLKKDTHHAEVKGEKGIIEYNQILRDVASTTSADLKVRYFVNLEEYKEDTLQVKTNVFAYTNFNKFCKDYKEKQNTPRWAYDSLSQDLVSTDGLTKIFDFSQELQRPKAHNFEESTISFPKELPAGYYLVDSIWEDKHFQCFLQVSNTGIFISKSKTKTFVWLNDIVTKKPMSEAKVTLESLNKTFITDEKGASIFDTKSLKEVDAVDANANNKQAIWHGDILGNDYLTVTTKDGFSSILFCGGNSSEVDNNYWNHFQTDRNLYQPTDTVKVWGYAKNRYANEEIKNLQKRLYKFSTLRIKDLTTNTYFSDLFKLFIHSSRLEGNL